MIADSDNPERQRRSPPRYAPEFAFPPYTYVPGRTPHPVSDPAGHMYGAGAETAELLVDEWPRCRAYLRGIDLFNHGYYWEAHEVWESLWHAAGRRGPVADYLKGLIKLAAAGVKSLEGSVAGRARHARRAAELLRRAAADLKLDGAARYMGLPVIELAEAAERAARQAPAGDAEESSAAVPFSIVLLPF